jgi:alkylhydroperoxidase/carboxymuconolactone decarboxylase family protein YurZ
MSKLKSHLEWVSKLMSQSMRNIANEELMVTQMQHIFDELQQSMTSLTTSTTDSHFAYHRLDLMTSPPQLCRHLKQLATIGLGTSYDCFEYLLIIIIINYY